MDELVERSLRQAALWDETKDKLRQSGPPRRVDNNNGYVLLKRSQFSQKLF